nr:retrovirus-related Pol polyprotein from transposon TNT 1-94 [Tanacetum cinerariifolium]
MRLKRAGKTEAEGIYSIGIHKWYQSQDGLGYDWSYIAQEEPTEFALMAYTSRSNKELSAKDKTGLGYGDQLSESDSEVLVSVFNTRSSDGDDNLTNDRFKKGDGYHAVSPPLNGNYMPPLADLSFAGLDDSVYRPTANKASASISKGEPSVINTSNINIEMPKVDSVRTSEVIIEDWVSDDEDTLVTQNSKADRKDWNGNLTQKPRISKETVNTVRINGVNTAGQTSVSTVEGNEVIAVKNLAGCVWRPKITDLNNVSKDSSGSWISKRGNPQQALNYKGMFDSGCSRHMTGNKALLTDYQDIDGGFVAFGGSTKGGKIIGIGHIRTNKIDFEDVFFMKELKFNLFSVSQICDKKNDVLFTESECLVLSHDFKLIDENQKGKQHKASCKAKLVSSISQHLQMLHMDLFGLTFVRSINHKTYCLGVTDDFSRTPQQNEVTERKNMTVIEDARTMLADSLLPTIFGAEAVNTACYVMNRVLVTKPHNKTPYELIIGRPPSISFMRPFGCPITILNTLDPLGKFDGKAEEGFLVGYSVNSKAFKVFYTQTRKVKDNLHVNFLENKPNVAGQGPNWLFNINSLANSMNYQPLTVENQANKNASHQKVNGDTGLKKNINVGHTEQEKVSTQEYTVFPLWSSISSSNKSLDDKAGDNTADDAAGKEKRLISTTWNLLLLPPIPTTRVHSNHPKAQIIGDPVSAVQTRGRKSTTGGCQFLGSRLISWQCKKQTMVANSTTEAEYIAASHCCAQVLWIQNQMLDYGYNFMQIKIHVDNESVICVIKNHESSIRRILRLDDAEGTYCLTNTEIFKDLARMSAKTTSWNEFSSTMASVIICLATNQKFNFSRYIQVPLPSPSHDPLPSGEDSLKLKKLMDLCTNLSNKVIKLESEVIDIKSTYKAKTEKLESRVERLEEENSVLKELKGVHSTVDSDEPVMEKEKSFKQERKIADIDADVKINLEKVQAKAYNLDLDLQEKVHSMLDVNDEEPANVEEVIEVVTTAKLITEVIATARVDVNAASVQDTPITVAEATKVTVEVPKPRKRRGVIIQDPEKTTTTVTVQPKVQAKDKEKAILIEEPKPLKRQVQIVLDEEVTRQLEAELNTDINWNAMIEQVKRS